jgi:hypothetical protein
MGGKNRQFWSPWLRLEQVDCIGSGHGVGAVLTGRRAVDRRGVPEAGAVLLLLVGAPRAPVVVRYVAAVPGMDS